MEFLGVHFMARQGEGLGTYGVTRDRGGTCTATVGRANAQSVILLYIAIGFPTLACYCTIVACFSAKRLEPLVPPAAEPLQRPYHADRGTPERASSTRL